ncbi:MAG: ribokinase [Thaumarchaeota archaeon]|nr:ribokinase [Nitrososphaerota archaeon]
MEIAILSHCTIDEISRNGNVVETPGGPATYCGLTAKKMGFGVELHTKVGPDFKFKQDIEILGLPLPERSFSNTPTTRFLLDIRGAERELYLKSMCDPVEYHSSDADGFIISPVFNEVAEETLDEIRESSNFLLLDPQGYLRRVDNSGRIFLDRTLLDISKVTAIKTDPEEAFHLTGLRERDAMLALQKRGAKHVLYTNKQEITMLVKDRMYSLRIPDMTISDTTGVGDIFCSAFACSYLKERDSLWAICFAVGAAQAALETKSIGLSKTPHPGAIQQNAAYLYNLVKFSEV